MPMAKSRRVTKKPRTPIRKPARVAKKRPPSGRAAQRRVSAKPVRSTAQSSTAAKPTKPVQAPPPQSAPLPPRKPTYHEAVAMYERGLQALQRRDFAASADALRTVIERYPDER